MKKGWIIWNYALGGFSDEKTEHLQNVYLNQRKMIDIPFDIKLHIKDIDD